MRPQTRYRLGRGVHMLATVLLLNFGLARESAPIIAGGGVLFVTFFPFSRLLADRVGHTRSDERTRELTRLAASRAAFLLFGIAFSAFLLGAALETTGGLGGVAETVYAQARVVVVWAAVAICVSSVAHGTRAWARRRGVEA
ncbi:hypothetical protein J2744_001464 [Halorubrum trapanicum]|uniref:Uncharacterized protein n=1 Tax=Halorubrum trapanicum TaxID=29284 RepID=A0A8J7UNE6_9EURY|nr:hypothetical protein [Halorubrum trapanicum]MBP1901786.1 hypothetical protein [Halorubrum trapanicum]